VTGRTGRPSQCRWRWPDAVLFSAGDCVCVIGDMLGDLPPILLRRRVANIQLICSWYFCSWNFTNPEVPDQAKFFARLGERIRKLRRAQGFSQEDMISFGFSARHWQQIEAGRPITVTTLLRICEVFRVPVARLLQGLDKGIYT
jgi:hypothetical protein